MSHTVGIGIIEPVKLNVSYSLEDSIKEKDRFEAQLKTYYDLLTIQNEQIKDKDAELRTLRDELHNVCHTRELERQTTTTQDSFTYLLLQRENNRLTDKVKSLEELYEKIRDEYARCKEELLKDLEPPKLIRQNALDLSASIKEQIETNNIQIKKLKKKSLARKKQEELNEKLNRLSSGKSSVA